MSVQYLRNREDDALVRVGCDGCHRACTSDMLMDDEICRLVGWTCDFGSVWCVLCQWRIGSRPDLARRLADQAGKATT